MTSRRILIWVILLPVFAASTTLAQSVAITFDDLPLNGELPPGMTRAQMVKDVVAILKRRKTPQIFGFVNAKKLEGNPDGAAALKEWVGGGDARGQSHLLPHRSAAEHRRGVRARSRPERARFGTTIPGRRLALAALSFSARRRHPR